MCRGVAVARDVERCRGELDLAELGRREREVHAAEVLDEPPARRLFIEVAREQLGRKR